MLILFVDDSTGIHSFLQNKSMIKKNHDKNASNHVKGVPESTQCLEIISRSVDTVEQFLRAAMEEWSKKTLQSRISL